MCVIGFVVVEQDEEFVVLDGEIEIVVGLLQVVLVEIDLCFVELDVVVYIGIVGVIKEGQFVVVIIVDVGEVCFVCFEVQCIEVGDIVVDCL